MLPFKNVDNFKVYFFHGKERVFSILFFLSELDKKCLVEHIGMVGSTVGSLGAQRGESILNFRAYAKRYSRHTDEQLHHAERQLCNTE